MKILLYLLCLQLILLITASSQEDIDPYWVGKHNYISISYTTSIMKSKLTTESISEWYSSNRYLNKYSAYSDKGFEPLEKYYGYKYLMLGNGTNSCSFFNYDFHYSHKLFNATLSYYQFQSDRSRYPAFNQDSKWDYGGDVGSMYRLYDSEGIEIEWIMARFNINILMLYIGIGALTLNGIDEKEGGFAWALAIGTGIFNYRIHYRVNDGAEDEYNEASALFGVQMELGIEDSGFLIMPLSIELIHVTQRDGILVILNPSLSYHFNINNFKIRTGIKYMYSNLTEDETISALSMTISLGYYF